MVTECHRPEGIGGESFFGYAARSIINYLIYLPIPCVILLSQAVADTTLGGAGHPSHCTPFLPFINYKLIIFTCSSQTCVYNYCTSCHCFALNKHPNKGTLSLNDSVILYYSYIIYIIIVINVKD